MREHGLAAGRELIENTEADKDPRFNLALTALLEVLPVSSAFTKLAKETGPVADAANDFDALENLRRLAYAERVPKPRQLALWESEEQRA